jgi:Serine carboxypeptidase
MAIHFLESLFLLGFFSVGVAGCSPREHSLGIGLSSRSTQQPARTGFTLSGNSTRLPKSSNITIRYKKTEICETTPDVNSFAGYVDLDQDSHVFFWFFEARNNLATTPTTLWLNGGPGSDSLIGLFNGRTTQGCSRGYRANCAGRNRTLFHQPRPEHPVKSVLVSDQLYIWKV